MIGAAAPADAVVATITQDTTVLEVIISDDEADEAVTQYETTVLPPRRIERRQFACQDYEFGYATCKNCHNEQAYYVHHADLADGYAFRCRVCRLEMTVMSTA
jgi:hypothetical protein